MIDDKKEKLEEPYGEPPVNSGLDLLSSFISTVIAAIIVLITIIGLLRLVKFVIGL